MENDKEQVEPDNIPDEFWEDYEGNEVPDYYYCNCCNHTQSELGMGNSCDNCGVFGVMEAEYF